MRKGIWLLVTAGLMLPVAACGGGDELKSGGSSSGGDSSKPSMTVGSANFPENVVLGEIYAGALTAKKFNVSKKLNIGARAAVFSGLERGDLTVVPEYTGSLLGYVSKGKGTGKDAADQVSQLKSSLPAKLTLLEPSTAEDKDTVTCNKGHSPSSTSRASRTSSPPARRSSWAGRPSSRAATASASRGSTRPTASSSRSSSRSTWPGRCRSPRSRPTRSIARTCSARSRRFRQRVHHPRGPEASRPDRSGRAADRQVRGHVRGLRRSSTT